MRIRNTAVPGLLTAAVVLAGACTEVAPPTEPLAFDQDVSLFGRVSAQQGPATTLDGMLVRIAQEHPGFGGFFYGEDGTLNVYMAGAQPMSSRLGSSLAQLGVDPTAQRVRVLAGQYDFVQLNAMHRGVSPVLGLAGVVFTDADEARNRVVVGVEHGAAAAAVERALAMAGVPSEAVIIELTEAIEIDQTLQSRVRPVAGGLQINFPGIPGFVCTHGFNVRSPAAPNVHGFVTNSHCSDERGVVTPTPYWQHRQDVPDTFIGLEEHDEPFFQGGVCPVGRNCRYSDALGARYDEGVDNAFARIYRTIGPNNGSLVIDQANPLFTIVDELPFPVIGQVLHKVGRTSGWTSGPVAATCQNTNVSGAGFVTMLCQDRIVTTSAGGDSGSPYFERIGETDQVRLVGIHWGSGGGQTVMSAMNNIRCENQGPAPWITFPGQTPPAPPSCPGR